MTPKREAEAMAAELEMERDNLRAEIDKLHRKMEPLRRYERSKRACLNWIGVSLVSLGIGVQLDWKGFAIAGGMAAFFSACAMIFIAIEGPPLR